VIRAVRYRRYARYLCRFTVFCTATILVSSRRYRR